MHPKYLAIGQQEAHARIVAATDTLRERHGLDGDPIPTTVNVRHPGVAMLAQQRAVADLLEQLVAASGKQAPDKAADKASDKAAPAQKGKGG